MKIQTVGGSLLNTNNYIVGNDERVILIDASAMPYDIKAIIGDRKVCAIFLTHGHWDHTKLVDEYVKEFNVQVYANKNAFEKIKYEDKQFDLDKPVKSKLTKEQIVELKDEEEIDFGFVKVKVIFTPGHTDCGISLLINDDENQALFTGDTLFFGTCGRYDLPSSSKSDMKKSLKKLLALDENLDVYPGHSFKTTIANERKTFNDIL